MKKYKTANTEQTTILVKANYNPELSLWYCENCGSERQLFDKEYEVVKFCDNCGFRISGYEKESPGLDRTSNAIMNTF